MNQLRNYLLIDYIRMRIETVNIMCGSLYMYDFTLVIRCYGECINEWRHSVWQGKPYHSVARCELGAHLVMIA